MTSDGFFGYMEFVTNAIYLLAGYQALKKSLYLEVLFFTLITCISSLYHLCYSKLTTSTSYCLFNQPYYHRLMDTMIASIMVMIMFVYLNPLIRIPCTKRFVWIYDDECKKDVKVKIRSRDYPALYVIIIVFGIFLWLAIQLKIGFSGNYYSMVYAQIALWSYLLSIWIVSIIFYYGNHPNVYRLLYNKFRDRFILSRLYISLILLGLAFVTAIFMTLKEEVMYKYCHFIWHILTAMAAYFFLWSLQCDDRDEDCIQEEYK